MTAHHNNNYRHLRKGVPYEVNIHLDLMTGQMYGIWMSKGVLLAKFSWLSIVRWTISYQLVVTSLYHITRP
jgi:hypothetical protein